MKNFSKFAASLGLILLLATPFTATGRAASSWVGQGHSIFAFLDDSRDNSVLVDDATTDRLGQNFIFPNGTPEIGAYAATQAFAEYLDTVGPAPLQFNGIPLEKSAVVPEPRTYLELVLGGLVLLLFIQRRKNQIA